MKFEGNRYPRLLSSALLAAALSVVMAVVPFDSRAQKTEATLAGILAPDHLITRSYQQFADRVRDKTKGALSIRVVPAGQMGGIKETVETTLAGNLEFTQVNNAALGNYYSRTMLFDLPFIFRDNDHMKKVVRGEIGTGIYAKFEEQTGMKILMAGMPDGPRSVWNSVRPVNRPQDMKGMKLRVMESPIMISTFESLGAIPTPMPFPEVYMAAKQRVIDGAETPPAGLLAMKAPEVAKYYSLTKHFALPAALGVNLKWFQKQPQQYQTAILEAANEARAWYDAAYDADEKVALETAIKQGMQVNDVANMADFRAAVKKVYDDYRDRVGGEAMIKVVIDTK